MKADKIRVFYGLLAAAGVKEQKINMISAYGVESTKDLSETQLDELITALRDLVVHAQQEVPRATRLKRSTIIGLLEQLGVYEGTDPERWRRVNSYLMEPRIAGKLMYEMSDEELDATARRLRAIIRKRNTKLQHEDYIARQN